MAQPVKSACNVGNLGLIPGSGRSPGEGHGNPFHGQNSMAEKPGVLQSMGLQRIRHDQVTDTSTFLMHDFAHYINKQTQKTAFS